MRGYFTANIDIQNSGAVVASPDHNTPGGSYYYHWARDGALTMHALQITASGQKGYDTQMQHYAKWVVGRHAESDPNNIDVRIEPKFTIPDGQPYTGGWCRPQTDGPGLRAITLIAYANDLISRGDTDFVSQYLWTGDASAYSGGAIKYDLDWLASNWDQSGCDLWEEVQSTDFFWNRYTMRKALAHGAQFAQKMGDSQSAQSYNSVLQTLNGPLARHFNGQFVFEEDNRQKDAAVMCAFNDGDMMDGVFAPNGGEVAGTISTLNDLFSSTFPINQKDNQAGVPGILYGRYAGDQYAGGNPWILTSGCLAETLYRAANATAAQNKMPPPTAASHFKGILRDLNPAALAAVAAAEGKALDLDTPAGLARALVLSGDGVLNRIRYHTINNNLHQPEQLDKNTGQEASATDLTWSYATILKAMKARDDTMATLAVRSDGQQGQSSAAFAANTQNGGSNSSNQAASWLPYVAGGVVAVALIVGVVALLRRHNPRRAYAPIA